MDTEQMTPKQIVKTYGPDVMKLSAYIPWFIEKKGKQTSSAYGQDDIAMHSISFPVFDANLLRFIKDAEETIFMDSNYHYIYSRYRIRTVEDELEAIRHAGIGQMNVLGGILSKYIFGGKTKGRLWSEAAGEGVFLEILTKAKELIEFFSSTKE